MKSWAADYFHMIERANYQAFGIDADDVKVSEIIHPLEAVRKGIYTNLQLLALSAIQFTKAASLTYSTSRKHDRSRQVVINVVGEH